MSFRLDDFRANFSLILNPLSQTSTDIEKPLPLRKTSAAESQSASPLAANFNYRLRANTLRPNMRLFSEDGTWKEPSNNTEIRQLLDKMGLQQCEVDTYLMLKKRFDAADEQKVVQH